MVETASNPRFDFAIRDRDGRLGVFVEAKKVSHADERWATQWHHTMRSAIGGARIVLVTPEKLFGWNPAKGDEDRPEWEFEATPILSQYMSRLHLDPNTIAPSVFESVVELWLRDVVTGNSSDGPGAEAARAVLANLKEGELVAQAAM